MKQARTKQHDQITRTLLFVTFAFIILVGWQCVTQCFWMIGQFDWIVSPTVDAYWELIDQMYAVGKLNPLNPLNSNLNFFVI